jgi:hypothetical protein
MRDIFHADTGKLYTYKQYYSLSHNKCNIYSYFSYPRADTYSRLVEHNTKVKAATREMTHRLIGVGNLHTLKPKHSMTLHCVELQSQSLVSVTAIAFDFMQNLPVPNMTKNKVLHSRQRWHHAFSIHDVGLARKLCKHIMRMTEHVDRILSLMLGYSESSTTADISELWLFSDDCPE